VAGYNLFLTMQRGECVAVVCLGPVTQTDSTLGQLEAIFMLQHHFDVAPALIPGENLGAIPFSTLL
jgi:hypothetical protein